MGVSSYFGGKRKGKRGRGAAGKVAVFGLLKRGGKVYTAIIPNARTETLLPIIQEKVELEPPPQIICVTSFTLSSFRMIYSAIAVGIDRNFFACLSQSMLLFRVFSDFKKMRDTMKVTLVVMALNEIEGMKQIMPQLDPTWFEQIIVADGGSTDGTIEWSRKQGYEVVVQSKKGIRFGYFGILDLIKGDAVISFSPDGNSPPEAIPQLIEKFKEGYDLVIGSRYLGDAKSEDDDVITAFGNWLFTRTVNLLHRGNYTDVMVIYRIYRTSLIYDLDLHKDKSYALPERLFSTIISWEPLMSVRAAKARMKIGEIPVDEPPRIGGERKLQIFRWGAAYYFQFWWELFNWKYSGAKRR